MFRIGQAEPFVVEVPRPVYEGSTLDFGVFLFERTRAKALFVAGAHPEAAVNGEADVVRITNKQSIFNLANQVILRDAGDEPLLVVQSRALASDVGKEPAQADILMAPRVMVSRPTDLSPLARKLYAIGEENGAAVKLLTGTAEVAGYEANNIAQAHYLDQTENKEFHALWLARSMRSAFQYHRHDYQQNAQLRALDIPTLTVSLLPHLQGRASRPGLSPVPDKVFAIIDRYARWRDVAALAALRHDFPGLVVERVIDQGTQQAFLVVSSQTYAPLVINLGAYGPDRPAALVATAVSATDVDNFVRRRLAYLQIKPEARKTRHQ